MYLQSWVFIGGRPGAPRRMDALYLTGTSSAASTTAFFTNRRPLLSGGGGGSLGRSHSPITLKRNPRRCANKSTKVRASISMPVSSRSDDLVASILSKVMQTDGGVSLTRDEHKKVAEVAQELQKFCVVEPVKCPLIFGEWDVVYCSIPTSPGGGYRSTLGRLFFRTKDMIQVVEAPNRVINKVSFSALGFLGGEVSLKGKLKALDEKWIQVVFERPELKVGELEIQYGSESQVKLEITYVDEKIRLGKGSRGSLFVFKRRKPSS